MELLSPAGHWEAMVAAVQSGADSVYMGCGGFNARRGAKNFTPQEFAAAVSYCHLRGVKVYMTLNTLLTDRELPQAEEYLRQASRWGVDGVIVQDWGLLALARAVTPELPLHGSTQMTVHSLEGVEAAAEMGMKCVVLSRELSREDAAFICRRSPIPIEVFAHGALCMCYSGQCAMSALIGERSGNRGTCAQPCRLPYQMDGGKSGHPLSLKDACLASHLGELAEMGVSILKLEGRMKRPEYVAVITSIYRRLLDEKRRPTREEQRQLELAFSRSGFTDGYYLGRKGPQMFGTRPENLPEPKELFAQARTLYEKEDRRTVAVDMDCVCRAGEPVRLTVRAGDQRAEVTGPVPETARNRALTAEELQARLKKTGGTAFRCREVRIALEEGLMLSAGAVNALRREGLAALEDTLCAVPERRIAQPEPLPDAPVEPAQPLLTCSLQKPAQLTQALVDCRPEMIYLPVEWLDTLDVTPYLDRTSFCAVLPRIFRTEDEAVLREMLVRHRQVLAAVAVGNLGHLPIAEGLELPLRGDLGMNVFNSRALLFLRELGLSTAAVSFELRHQQIRDLKKYLPCEAVVYGRLPLMLMENCVIANSLGCCDVGSDYRKRSSACRCTGENVLTDRTGARFPLMPAWGHRNELENSRTLFLADKPEWRRLGLTYARLRFTTESPAECVAALQRYQGQGDYIPADLTRGLFYRGVE
mgnify:CR=1 FL=1